jgi:hypothetical protein
LLEKVPRSNVDWNGLPLYFRTMGNDHHDHHEAEQNEIGGPVVFALFLFAIVVIAIGMMAS